MNRLVAPDTLRSSAQAVGVWVAIEFRILGSVQARIGDVVVDVGPARQRCVLAVLLVDANQVVSAHQLADRVWGDRVAHRANGTLRTYLSRLRKALASADDVEIGRRSGGYVLAVDPMAVDLHDFRHLVARARGSVDEDSAAALYEQALRLWRGEPFAGMDAPWLNRIRDVLEAERHAAELDHADLRLRRGQHGALLAGLTALAAAHPLDERLAGQLMLAHYRSGRQADALAHYQAIRSQLAEDLGTDPGAPLRELHQQMLTADPTLIAPAIGVTGLGSTHSAVPAQLPADIVTFTGRAAELNHFLAVWPDRHHPLSSTVVISAIDGMAGVGKTALAVHAAHQVKDRFPDGQLFVDLHGFTQGIDPTEPADALDTLLRALGKTGEQVPPTLAERAALLRTTLAGRRVLLVLDNAATETQVRPLLPGAPGCLVLVTSRSRLVGLDATHLMSLDVMPPQDSYDLFARVVGDARAATESSAVRDILELCGFLPLAIAIAAARLRHRPMWTIGQLAARLRDQQRRLVALNAGGRDVAAVFSLSYHHLQPDQQRIFRLSGLHPGADLDSFAAAAIADVPVRHGEQLLEALVDAHLLQQPGPNRYRFHALMREFALDRSRHEDDEATVAAAKRRMLDWYLHSTAAAARKLNPNRSLDPVPEPPADVHPAAFTSYQQALDWLDARYDRLLAAHRFAAEVGMIRHAWLLPWVMSHYRHHVRGRLADSIEGLEAALAVCRETADDEGQAYVLSSLGVPYAVRKQHDKAIQIYRQAVAVSQKIGTRGCAANALINLAISYGSLGRHYDAVLYAQEALGVAVAMGSRVREGAASRALGKAYLGSSRVDKAFEYLRRALAIGEDLDYPALQAMVLLDVGRAHRQLGDQDEAIAAYEQALSVNRSHGLRFDEGTVLTELGDLHRARGDQARARGYWQQALAMLNDLDHPSTEQLRTKLRRNFVKPG